MATKFIAGIVRLHPALASSSRGATLADSRVPTRRCIEDSRVRDRSRIGQARGRLTGTNGERLARDYLIGELQRIGARPIRGQAFSPVVRIYRRHSRWRLDHATGRFQNESGAEI